MNAMRWIFLVIGGAAFVLARAGSAPAMMQGGVLVDAAGMTLYSYDHDGLYSACNGRCAELWPPFLVADEKQADDNFSVVKRDDGSHQWAYKGKPLYLWKGDIKPGDVDGDGVNGVWHVIK